MILNLTYIYLLINKRQNKYNEIKKTKNVTWGQIKDKSMTMRTMLQSKRS